MLTQTISQADVWQKQAVADAQRALIEKELQETAAGNPPPPFRVFMEVMEVLRKRTAPTPLRLLDVGCGVAHYGVLCERYYPEIIYTGTDLSAAMRDHARKLLANGTVRRASFFQNPFHKYDVVLVGQVMEMLADPLRAFETVLRNIRPTKYAIFHRVRITEDPSQPVSERTYCDLPCTNYLWNETEFVDHCYRYGDLLLIKHWGAYTSFLFQRSAADATSQATRA